MSLFRRFTTWVVGLFRSVDDTRRSRELSDDDWEANGQ